MPTMVSCAICYIIYIVYNAQYNVCAGDSSSRGAESLPGTEGGQWCYGREFSSHAAEVSTGNNDNILLLHWYIYTTVLQTLNGISAEKNSTVIFPIPMDLLKKYITHNKQ